MSYTRKGGNPNKKKGKKRNYTNGKKKRIRKLKPVVFGHVYSNDCIHCKNMQSEWNKLCKRPPAPLHDIGGNYENEVSLFNEKYNTNLEVQGLPTIFRIPNNSNTVDYYRGDRSASKMRKWIFS